MLSIPLGIRYNAHVGIDMVVQNCRARGQARGAGVQRVGCMMLLSLRRRGTAWRWRRERGTRTDAGHRGCTSACSYVGLVIGQPCTPACTSCAFMIARTPTADHAERNMIVTIVAGVHVLRRCWACRSRSRSAWPASPGSWLGGFDLIHACRQGMMNSIDSFPLMAIPLLHAGRPTDARGGIMERLIERANSVVGVWAAARRT